MSDAVHPPLDKESGIPCIVCGGPLAFSLSQTRRAQKPFIQVSCPRDPKHFHGFINDVDYVRGVLERLGGHPIEDGPS